LKTDIDGNPQISFINPDDPKVTLGLSHQEAASLARAAIPGACLNFTRLTLIDLVGLRIESPPSQVNWPVLTLGPIHIQIRRVRLFYYTDEQLQSAVFKPMFVDLAAPAVPFVEITWNPNSGKKICFIGLEKVDSRDMAIANRGLSSLLAQWELRSGQAGRRRKNLRFKSKEQIEAAIFGAARSLEEMGESTAAHNIAKYLRYSGKEKFSAAKALTRDLKRLKETRSVKTLVKQALTGYKFGT
jgi:hypothetical protein